MSKINRHPVRRTAAGVLAGALALSGAVAAAVPANAAPGFTLDRLDGVTRYDTSARIAEAFGPSTGAILATLGCTAVLFQWRAPVMLQEHPDRLFDYVLGRHGYAFATRHPGP